MLFASLLLYHKGTLGTRGFSRVRWEFSVLAEATRKTSGTERCFLPFPLTFELFYRITFTPIRLKVSNRDHVGRHVKKCPKTHIILRKTTSSLKLIALIKKSKNGLLPTFSPDFTWNRQIWLFYAEKWIFFKKLGTLLNPFAPGDFAEKRVLKLVEWFSGHCRAIKKERKTRA